MWILVFIYFYDTFPFAEKVTVHPTMTECFQAREALSEEVGKVGGYFNAGQQALCINIKD